MGTTAQEFAYMDRLRRPQGRVDVVIDTDAYNEIDDLYALSYLILSEQQLNLQAIFAAPFYSPPSLGRTRKNHSPREGMEQSYCAVMELLDVMKREDLKTLVFRGSCENMKEESVPVESDAARELIRLARAHTPEHPLYVIAIAVLTDIASAMLLAPDILDRIVVIWLGGHGYEWNSCSDFNTIQDIAAARVVFGSGAAIVQLPCLGVVSEFLITGIELEYRLKGRNELCDYLLKQTLDFMRERTKTQNWSKPLWDVTAVAWLLGEEFMQDRFEHSPIFEYDNRYSFDHTRHFIKYVYKINRDILYDNLFEKLIGLGRP